jgi:ABC-type branched-subunit amino acid transport system substrate-binding protein
VLAEDDQCDAQVGVQVAAKLVTEGIAGIVGSFCSGAAIPESGVLRQHGDLPFIAPTASNPKFTEQGYDNVYRIGFRDDSEAPIDASYLHDYLKVTRLAILHDNTTFAKGLADLVKASYVQSSGAQVVFYDAITPGQKDYSATMIRIA